jgi:hypothetical protein
MGIKGKTTYEKRRKEDLGLPSDPSVYYADKGWVSWPDFFGGKRSEYYPTYEEAQRAVKKLRIKSYAEYRQRYKEDPKLPSHPDGYYYNKGWLGLCEFLGIKSK